MHNKIENFIFDLDGTIINSSKEVLQCFKAAFDKAGYSVNKTKFTSNIIGPPLRQIMQLIAPELTDEVKIAEIMQNFRKIYDYDENDISIMYDGLYKFLIKLKEQNKKLFIATFKPKIPTMRLIKKFNLNMFDDIYTIDKFDKPISKAQMVENIICKYNLTKEETVMIGDAPSDMTAAKDNNITAIGALWGYGDNKTALKENADFCIENIEELKWQK